MAGVFPPQGVSAAGGLTGVTEDGGSPVNVVTVADDLLVGSASTGVLVDSSGGTITRASSSNSSLALYSYGNASLVLGTNWSGSSGSARLVVDQAARVIGSSSTSFQWSSASSPTVGPFDLSLARNAAGRLQLSDPSGSAGARLDLLDSGGAVDVSIYEASGVCVIDGSAAIQLYRNGVLKAQFGSADVRFNVDAVPSAAGGAGLGTTALPWDALTLGDAANEGSVSKAWTTTLTDGSATDLVTIAVADGEYAGGELVVAIYATDGTDDQIRVETVRFGAYNIGGTITADISATATADDALATSTGTLTAAFTETSATNVLTLRLTATSSLTTTTLEARCHGVFLAGAQTVTPQ